MKLNFLEIPLITNQLGNNIIYLHDGISKNENSFVTEIEANRCQRKIYCTSFPWQSNLVKNIFSRLLSSPSNILNSFTRNQVCNNFFITSNLWNIFPTAEDHV